MQGRYIRIRDLVSAPKRAGRLPIAAATVWRKCANGLFPEPIKLGPQVSAWLVDEVEAMEHAWNAGKSEAEIRKLVQQLHAARTRSGRTSTAPARTTASPPAGVEKRSPRKPVQQSR